MLGTIRRIVGSWAGERGDAVDLDEIVARLELAKIEVDRTRDRLMQEIEKEYGRMIEAAKRGDEETSELTAAELVLKKKVLTFVITYSKLLAMAIQRLKGARSIEMIARELATLEYVMKATSDYLLTTSPEVTLKLHNIMEATANVIRSAEISVSSLPSKHYAEVSPEIRQEIARVLAEAKKESDQIVPSVTAPKAAKAEQRVDQGAIEERLLQYVIARGGHISISQASADLGVSPEQVRHALKALEEKGKIQIHRKQAEQQLQ